MITKSTLHVIALTVALAIASISTGHWLKPKPTRYMLVFEAQTKSGVLAHGNYIFESFQLNLYALNFVRDAIKADGNCTDISVINVIRLDKEPPQVNSPIAETMGKLK